MTDHGLQSCPPFPRAIGLIRTTWFQVPETSPSARPLRITPYLETGTRARRGMITPQQAWVQRLRSLLKTAAQRYKHKRLGGWTLPPPRGMICAQLARQVAICPDVFVFLCSCCLQLLHLHPLTLEDILQRDPREKLELFPRLGYYFVVFRAIESHITRQRFQRLIGQDVESGHRGDEGVLREALVYLVVFREGVCSVGGHLFPITWLSQRGID
jgi:hypothetical protein